MNKTTAAVLATLALTSMEASATNVYNSTNNQVTIDYVVVGDYIYSDVKIKVSEPKIASQGEQCKSTRTYNKYDSNMNMVFLDSVSDNKNNVQYCDVDAIVKEIVSHGDVTPVEIFTNTYNPDTGVVSVDYINSGGYYYYNNDVSISNVFQNNQVGFFNEYDPIRNTATLHSVVDLSSGNLFNYDSTVGVNSIVKSGLSKPISATKTTVLVYMIGTDLEEDGGFASSNIKEMTQVGSTDNMTIILQTGGANKASSNFKLPVNWTHVQRWKVGRWNPQTPDDLSQALTLLMDNGQESSKTYETPGLDMGFAATLQNFIQWGMNAYPAEKYILVMWSHSGGINRAFGPDTITKNKMSIPSIVDAIQNSPKPFELVAFDSCFNGTAEIAAGLSLRAKFMAGSEDLQPGSGYDYTTFLQQIVKYPDAGGDIVGKVLAGSFYLKSAQGNNIYNRPYSQLTSSVIDLTKISALKSATDEFSSNLRKYANSDVASWFRIARARSDALDFSTLSILGESLDLVDMKLFAENIKRQFRYDIALGAASDKVKAAIDSVVVYNKKSLADQSATGLTVYFPSILSAYPNQNYAKNTAVKSGPFFSVNYTDEKSGLLASYYGFYDKNKQSLAASIGSISNPGGVFSAVVTNPVETAMAAIGNDKCQLINYKQETVTEKCYQAMTKAQVSSNGTPTTLNFNKNSALWPLLNGIPVILLPNSPTRRGYGDYLIPVTKTNIAGKMDGYLRVTFEQSTNIYRVDGFILYSHSVNNLQGLYFGDIITMKNLTITLGAIPSQDSYYFLESADKTKSFVVSPGPLTLSFGTVSANDQFTFFTTDLTGAIAKAVDFPY